MRLVPSPSRSLADNARAGAVEGPLGANETRGVASRPRSGAHDTRSQPTERDSLRTHRRPDRPPRGPWLTTRAREPSKVDSERTRRDSSPPDHALERTTRRPKPTERDSSRTDRRPYRPTSRSLANDAHMEPSKADSEQTRRNSSPPDHGPERTTRGRNRRRAIHRGRTAAPTALLRDPWLTMRARSLRRPTRSERDASRSRRTTLWSARHAVRNRRSAIRYRRNDVAPNKSAIPCGGSTMGRRRARARRRVCASPVSAPHRA
jgi:hypothetical protein